ncbi:hypothetical protein ElyMa_000177500 [Elysia marginata]|uniref:Uncharacterized protein n=1 Tax=Elysia marginata TaxID=1093978 RepID=A0AAV4EUG0_9GAST|nr:hypothetical protein ElyMa_000177500 [Elysia marginata]
MSDVIALRNSFSAQVHVYLAQAQWVTYSSRLRSSNLEILFSVLADMAVHDITWHDKLGLSRDKAEADEDEGSN